MTITSVNPLCDERWDEHVDAFAEASFFHRTPWLRVLHDTYGFTPCYILATDTNETRAMLPMMEVDSWLTGKRGVSLPFTDECAPLGGQGAELFEAAIALGRQRRWKRIEVRSNRFAHEGHESREKKEPARFATAKPSVTFYGHRLQLRATSRGEGTPPTLAVGRSGPDVGGVTSPRVPSLTAELFANCDSSTRRAVRKAEQSGVQIEFSRSLEAVRTFYGLLKKTRQRHGAPPQPFRFFLKLHQHALQPGHGWVVLARSSGIPVAGAVFLHTKQDAIYKYGASDERYQNLRANNLVMWRAIEWYAQNNFNSLDFGRTSLGNDGLRRFKLGWATAERMLNYFQYNLRTNEFQPGRDESAGWHAPIFRRLPRWMSQLIGTALYKHTA
jgi:hypothetical protein